MDLSHSVFSGHRVETFFLIRVLLTCSAVLVSGVQQNESVIHISTLLHSFPILAITEYPVEFPVLHSRFLLVIYCILYTAVVFVHPRLPSYPSLPYP